MLGVLDAVLGAREAVLGAGRRVLGALEAVLGAGRRVLGALKAMLGARKAMLRRVLGTEARLPRSGRGALVCHGNVEWVV